jgi:16S rRNA (guanine527-N7)-methyltransferase
MSKESILLRTVCLDNGLRLNEEQLLQLEILARRLLEWNKKINLVSRRDEDNLWSSHILHSLSVLFKLHIPRDAVVLDLGTGGGLPGLPVKIARPDLVLTLLDSTQKKINVVKEIITDLGLREIDAVWGRAEKLGRQPQYAEQFDIVIARAVGPLRDLVKWSAPFLSKGPGSHERNEHQREGATRMVGKSVLIAMKGGDLEGEIKQIRGQRSVEAIEVIDLTLRGSTQLEAGEKKLVVVNLRTKEKAG